MIKLVSYTLLLLLLLSAPSQAALIFHQNWEDGGTGSSSEGFSITLNLHTLLVSLGVITFSIILGFCDKSQFGLNGTSNLQIGFGQLTVLTHRKPSLICLSSE